MVTNAYFQFYWEIFLRSRKNEMEESLYLALSEDVEKKRKIDMTSNLAGYFNSISRRMVSDRY